MYLTEMNVQTNSSMTRNDIIECVIFCLHHPKRLIETGNCRLVKRARLTGEQPIRRRSSRRQPQQESASANVIILILRMRSYFDFVPFFQADRTAPERRPSERIPLELFLAEQFIRVLLSAYPLCRFC